MNQIRVLIVDDHAIVREGLRTLLAEAAEITVVGEAATGAEAIPLALATQPDVILIDLLMPELDGIAAMAHLRAAGVRSHVLVLASFADDRYVRAAVAVGAVGYLLKDVLKPELLQAIRAAAQGRAILHPAAQHRLVRQVAAPADRSPLHELTERERDVLSLIASGCSNRTIAATLHLTEGTVKGYVSTILGKLGVADWTQAALLAVQHGLRVENVAR